ncbi:hypothetical protein [Pseudomonas solani]|uniref:hypothetical protein n=1 Tax=Pseudomonas solani TaxID=2731552 RepID=UPI003D6B8BE7
MAVKVSGFARLLVALTLLAWGQFTYAVDYYWQINSGDYGLINGPTPVIACQSYVSRIGATGAGVERSNDISGLCWFMTQSGSWVSSLVYRVGDSCSGVYDSQTGECKVPINCSASSGKAIYAAVQCSYVASSKTFSCPSTIKYTDGCEYVTSPNGTNRCDVSTSICVNRMSGSGSEAPSGSEECSSNSCAPVPSQNPPPAGEGCVTNGTNTTCITNEEKGCVSVNGKEVCYEPGKQCGTFNHTFTCISSEKPSRNCIYANGKQVCIDPKDPTKQIAETSSDHPINGGNADGDDTNDPRAPGAVGTSPQGSNAGATNQGLEDLGEKLGPKIDKTNSLLDGIGQKIDDIIEGLFGDEFSDSDLGAEGEAKQAGEEAAAGLPAIFEEQQEKILEERDAQADSYLKSLPRTVEKEWFGVDGQLVGLNNVLNKVLPTAMGCADYRIPLSLDSYNANLVIPVCELTRIKPLLEWVIWMITLIGLWKILYSALRQEDVKASKGGF